MSRNHDLARIMRKPADAESNLRLLPLVAAGDPQAREEMILSNVALVAAKVKSFLDYYPEWRFLRDDLMSQGFVGLIQAVNKMAGVGRVEDSVPGEEHEKNNPTGLMSSYIYHRLGELVDKELSIRIPGRTFRRRRAAGEQVAIPTKEGAAGVEDMLDREGARDPRAMVELLDELMGACETYIERQIVRLRMEGRKDDEIAERLGIPRSTTHWMRKTIYARFLERNPEMKGE